MTIITTDSLNTKHFSKGSRFGKDATVEDFFRDFWSGIEGEVGRKEKLEQELLILEEDLPHILSLTDAILLCRPNVYHLLYV